MPFEYQLLLFYNASSVFWFILFASVIILDVFAIIHIVINKHDQPTSAILWMFIIIYFHFVGLFIYLLLGINRLKTKGVKVQRSDGVMLAHKGKVDKVLGEYIKGKFAFRQKERDDAGAEYSFVLDRLLPRSLPMVGNELKLLQDGTTAYPEMIEAIRGAKKHIHLQSYIIMADEIGTKIFQELDKKALEGVEIKVLFDRMGSGKAYSSHFFKYWEDSSINFEVKPFSKVNLFAPYRIQLRNHRKLILIDGKKAFVGGINISAENDRRVKCKNYIHDLHAVIEGPVVGQFQYRFLRDWSYVTKISPLELISRSHYFPLPEKKGDSVVRVSASGPGQAYEYTEKFFNAAAATAKESIWIATPYFVPDKPFIQALKLAAARRVEIKIIIPQNNNHWYVRYASRSLYDTLLEAGVRIFEKKGDFSHAKAMLVDAKWGAMGSSNCDNRSFRLNYELDFIVEGGSFIEDLHYQFLDELENSEEILLVSRQNKPFYEELLEDFCSLLNPVL